MPTWETGHKSNTSITQYTELDFSILLKEKQNPSKAVRVRVQGTGMKAMRFRSAGIQWFPCHLGYSFCGFSCIFLPATSPLPFIARSFWLPRAFVNHTLLNVNFHSGTRGYLWLGRAQKLASSPLFTPHNFTLEVKSCSACLCSRVPAAAVQDEQADQTCRGVFLEVELFQRAWNIWLLPAGFPSAPAMVSCLPSSCLGVPCLPSASCVAGNALPWPNLSSWFLSLCLSPHCLHWGLGKYPTCPADRMGGLPCEVYSCPGHMPR